MRVGEGRAVGLRLAMIGLLLASLGCVRRTAEPEPFRGPDLEVTLRHYLGSPLAGPRVIEEPEVSGPFRPVRITLYALEGFPESDFSPVATWTHLIATEGDRLPLRAAPQILRNASLSDDPERVRALRERLESGDLGGWERLSESHGVLAPGVTLEIAARTPPWPEDIGFEEPRFTVSITDPEDRESLLIGLAAEGLGEVLLPEEEELEVAAMPEEKEEEPPEPISEIPIGELVLLDVAGPEAVVGFLGRSPFLAAARGLFLVIEVGPAPGEGSPEAAALEPAIVRCRFDVEETARQAIELATVLRPASPVGPRFQRSQFRPAVATSRERRSLAFVARTVGARFSEDVALSAPDVIVGEAIRRGQNELGSLDRWPDREGLAMILERTAYEAVLGEIGTIGSRPGLESLVLRHAGELVRHPALIEEILRKSRHAADPAAAAHPGERDLPRGQLARSPASGPRLPRPGR
jgi:hypothetical protein